MVGTINRAVCAKGQCHWPIPAVLHIAALLAGAAASGLVVWHLNRSLLQLPPGPTLAAAAALALLCAIASETLVWRFSLSVWQVPRRWRGRIGPHRLAVSYGFLLGIPFLTRTGPLALGGIVGVVATAVDPALPVAALSAFGIGRATPYALGAVVEAWPGASAGEPNVRLEHASRDVAIAAYVLFAIIALSVSYG
jgi:hypothetical protein